MEVYNTIKSSYPSNVVLLNGSEVVKLPVGLYEIMPWTEFNATEAAPAGNMELAYHKYTYIYFLIELNRIYLNKSTKVIKITCFYQKQN